MSNNSKQSCDASSNQRGEVEFPCGHTVAHEEDCPRCESDRLREALQTIVAMWEGNANDVDFTDGMMRVASEALTASPVETSLPAPERAWVEPRGVGFALIACFLKAEDAQLVRNHLAIPAVEPTAVCKRCNDLRFVVSTGQIGLP